MRLRDTGRRTRSPQNGSRRSVVRVEKGLERLPRRKQASTGYEAVFCGEELGIASAPRGVGPLDTGFRPPGTLGPNRFVGSIFHLVCWLTESA